MPHDLPKWDEPEFWTWSGCVSLFGVFLAFIGVAGGAVFAVGRDGEGLLLVIVFLLALSTAKRS